MIPFYGQVNSTALNLKPNSQILKSQFLQPNNCITYPHSQN